MIAIVPARGGSQGVLRKNVRPAGGKPLIAWTIEAAKSSASVKRIIVTTDDLEIADLAKQYGAEVPFLRPADLATDTATSVNVVAHALHKLGFDEESDAPFILLQPTSPLRTSGDIDAAAALLEEAEAVVSVTVVSHPPQWLRTIDTNRCLQPWLSGEVQRRQDSGALYELNGAIYITRAGRFLRELSFSPAVTAAYVMPKERSLDIDTEFDLQLCNLLLTQNETHV